MGGTSWSRPTYSDLLPTDDFHSTFSVLNRRVIALPGVALHARSRAPSVGCHSCPRARSGISAQRFVRLATTSETPPRMDQLGYFFTNFCTRQFKTSPT
jgi:hypothetical protein